MPRFTTLAVVLLVLNGGLAGFWSHRWDRLSEPHVQARVERIEGLPLSVGEWSGERVVNDSLTLPEEQIGRGVTVRYVSCRDGTAVSVFLAAGPTDGIVGHTPRACYPANGFTCPRPDLKITPPIEGRTPDEFYVSDFTKADPIAPTHLRVFWSWSGDGLRWQVPGNPRRAFRSSAAVYKCYAVRQVVSPDEPVEADPAVRLLSDLLPELDRVLGASL